MSWLFLIAGIVVLYVGGELLIAHSSKLARRLGVSPLVVGLTVVAFGTSAPELASSVAAVLQNAHGVAFGNAVGSNIANLGIVLGLAALVTPISTGARFLKREVPFMIVVTLVLWPMVMNYRLERWEGGILLALMVVYLTYLLRHRRASTQHEQGIDPDADRGSDPIWLSVGAVVLGLVLLVAGAKALVVGAVDVARSLGVSDRVIGLTLVAGGTSLPELAASVVAAYKRESDMLLGNLIGSNVLNILLILGVTAMVRPIEVGDQELWVDLGVMLGFSLIVVPFLYTGLRLARIEGAILVVAYGGYVWSLFW